MARKILSKLCAYYFSKVGAEDVVFVYLGRCRRCQFWRRKDFARTYFLYVYTRICLQVVAHSTWNYQLTFAIQ